MADIGALSDEQLLSSLGPAPSAAPARAPQAQAQAFTPATFAKQYGGAAQIAADKLGVDPSILLGQWGLETGWGKSVIPGTNNLGNIKDFSGSGVAATDNANGSRDKYRAYASPEAFANDYADLISRRYPGAVGAGADVAKYATALKAGGYAEDPNYVGKLLQVASSAKRANPSEPGLLARVGNAAASAISGTANAATPQELSGISDADLLAALGSRGVQAPQPQKPGMTVPGGFLDPAQFTLDNAGRQLGLTARAAGHGIADALGVVGNPLNALINMATGSKLENLDTLVRRGVDAITPAPANKTEQVVGDVAGAIANPVNLIGGPIMQGATGVASTIGRGAVAGAVTGAMQPVHAEDTLGDIGKRAAVGAVGGAAGAAVGAGVGAVADKLMTGIGNVVSRVRAALPGGQTQANISADDILRAAASEQGIDLAAIPQSILTSARTQVADALGTNRTVDAAALLRRAEGEAVLGPQNGLTLGQATRDPMQFATERNLRGVAGAGEPLTERFAGQNRALIDSLNQRGASAAPGEYQAGQGVIDSLAARDAAAQKEIGALYNTARSYGANDIPLDHRAFADQAMTNLDREMRGAFLPPQIRDIMNGVSRGDIPLNVQTSEQLKSMLAESTRTAQRAGDGNTVRALGIVRDALEGAQPAAPTRFGGNQLVPAGTPLPPSDPGPAAVAAFNEARAAARARFGEIESNPALQAVVKGDAVPDNFFKRYVVNGNVRDVNSLMNLVPDQGAALRAQVVDYLKQKALNGASDEVGVFSQSAYNKALNSIGDAKLSALFSAEDVAALKQIGRVASNIQAQPAGSAVNNSNTGSAVMNLLSQMNGRVGSLPGLNLARNSINQFLNERTAAQALAGQIQSTPAARTSETLNQLLPLLPGISGGAAVPAGR